MVFSIRSFQIQKAGSEECQDAFAWDESKRLFAIADGANDSAFQRLWAMLLVQGFISQPPTSFSPPIVEHWFGGWLEAQQTKWNESIDWNNIPWHGLNKARQTGGLATFLGVYLSHDKPLWRGIAFGDCNLFHIQRDGNLHDYKPLTTSKDFGIDPVALSSINPHYDIVMSNMYTIGGEYHVGDVILLTTDALAEWLVKQKESNKKPWGNILKLRKSSEFERFVDKLRRKKEIRNDDTSLLVIQIDQAPEESALHTGSDA